MLRIYVSAHCPGCAIARERAAQLRRRRPDIPLALIDVEAAGARVPRNVVGTPVYTWDDRILYRGNPSEEDLVGRVAELHDEHPNG